MSADESPSHPLPVAHAIDKPDKHEKSPAGRERTRGFELDPRVLFVGGAVAAIGVAVFALFLWMVPNAAARELQAACRGLHAEGELYPVLCPGGTSCSAPVPAPDFTAVDMTGKSVKLSDFKGSWLVLYFYPNDDTPGCTTEACDFTNGLKDFEKLEAVVVGCSPNTTESHRKFIAKYKLKVRLLSDPEHKAMEAYGAWGEKSFMGRKYMGIYRVTFLIGPDGRIEKIWPQVKPEEHAAEVLASL